MGPSESKNTHKSHEEIQPCTNYQLDLRMIEILHILPSSFSYSTQKLIEQIQILMEKIQAHSLQKYLIFSINQRFSRYSIVSNKAFSSQADLLELAQEDNNKFQNIEWSQLKNKQQFLKLLKHFQNLYEIELRIKQQIEQQGVIRDKSSNPQLGFETLRKSRVAMTIKAEEMDEGLIMRLIFHYYVVMLKSNANRSDKSVLKFHGETGRLLCYMIYFGHLNVEQLFQFLYWLVYINKHEESTIRKKLQIIHKQYHSLCLKNNYKINIEKRRLSVIETAARMYLDELYLKSIHEAEDPDIKSSDDSLMPIKMFPISRVKDKSRL